MAKSLYEIEDYYMSKGITDGALHRALENDSEYQVLLLEKRRDLALRLGMSKTEAACYVLTEDGDYEMLTLIKKLEKLAVTDSDRVVLDFAKTQLQRTWREPLMQMLHNLAKKYTDENNYT